MKVSAIIAAGGIGKRMGASRPKQYIELSGRPIICRTLDRFRELKDIDELIVVVPADYVNSFKSDIIDRYNYPQAWKNAAGGLHRQDSVRNGFDLVSKDCNVVLVHDGVRPFISARLIEKSIETAFKEGAAIVAAPVKETIKKAGRDRLISGTVDRQGLWGAQTPQAFRYEILKKAMETAYRDNFYGTDEASIVERIGVRVKIVEGDYKNIKITTPDDILVAEAIVKTFNN
jgi:2-C-methyl-D-erythritol 4-phosphate cytidylyltransferase